MYNLEGVMCRQTVPSVPIFQKLPLFRHLSPLPVLYTRPNAKEDRNGLLTDMMSMRMREVGVCKENEFRQPLNKGTRSYHNIHTILLFLFIDFVNVNGLGGVWVQGGIGELGYNFYG